MTLVCNGDGDGDGAAEAVFGRRSLAMIGRDLSLLFPQPVAREVKVLYISMSDSSTLLPIVLPVAPTLFSPYSHSRGVIRVHFPALECTFLFMYDDTGSREHYPRVLLTEKHLRGCVDRAVGMW